MAKTKIIKVAEDTWELLMLYKIRWRRKSLDEVINDLIRLRG